MCTNINVTLPTVVSFLLLYSLRCGCIIILLWTLLRALFFLVWCMITAIETFLPRPPPLGAIYPEKPGLPTTDDNYFFAFVSYLIMIVTESFLTIFTIYLGMGLYYDSPGRIEQYLVCRFCTWLAEIVVLVVLCLTHNYLIGWYLVFLMIVILEFYAFIVVYSYYVDIVEEKAAKQDNRSTDPTTCCSC
ncbi:uncharacterized protein LOC113506625 [Trichoplusia ni]|uniref:Uncharacterized protein LOC113503825 n=1 Tax=Trichoplusia ni TaxID=7111 RepID=A0A7E5WYJ8_TRINI|nr:uncharacterized protein LOC113503825 [Trichoplusia ni]XP_026745261.1 uncharacterized protein LOC113506625 [Trichoplusia ni]